MLTREREPCASQGYVVTCSGAYKSGSLRVVRSGVGLHELASLEVEGVQRVWAFAGPSLGEGQAQALDELLVLGFFDETRVFKLVRGAEGDDAADADELDLEELDLPFFTSDAATLFAGVLAGGVVVQVTAQGVSYDGGRWQPAGGNKKVTAAAAREGGECIAVAVEGGGLVVLRAEGGALVEAGYAPAPYVPLRPRCCADSVPSVRRSTTFPHDIAALALSPTGAHAAVALWTTQEIHLVALGSSSLEPCATHTIDSTFLIRSVALTAFSASNGANGAHEATLLAGLGDGTLVSLPVDLAAAGGKGAFAPASSAKAVPLGKRPLMLTEVGGHGDDRAVFVASDRPTIVSRSKDRLVYSGVNLAVSCAPRVSLLSRSLSHVP